MKIIRAKDYDDMSRKAANIISAQMIMKPNCVLGLATGSTHIGVYGQLVSYYQDEYRGISRDNEQSYYYFMHDNLFSKVNIDLKRTFLPDGMEPDSAKACQDYDRVIGETGGVDLQLLGLGHNGHIGFNEPGPIFKAQTHCVKLAESTIKANRRFFASEEEVPK